MCRARFPLVSFPLQPLPSATLCFAWYNLDSRGRKPSGTRMHGTGGWRDRGTMFSQNFLASLVPPHATPVPLKNLTPVGWGIEPPTHGFLRGCQGNFVIGFAKQIRGTAIITAIAVFPYRDRLRLHLLPSLVTLLSAGITGVALDKMSSRAKARFANGEH